MEEKRCPPDTRVNGPAVDTVHLVFKTHLDIGFTHLAREVVEGYFTRHLPGAIALARRRREVGLADRFVWTTGSWLIYEYLEQADAAGRRALEAAIAAGDIAWHALPFTAHSELMDDALFRHGLGLSRTLDRRFGRRTIAAKMTDVPGHTRSIVPLLAESGVAFLHIGVNPASTSPDVPDLFVWRCGGEGEVTVMYHKATYGDAMTVPGLSDALLFAHTGDNQGPQNDEAVTQAFAAARARFPGATARAATLDDFARALDPVRAALPVVTGELGDMWIHGVGTDPWKTARLRALCRLRRRWAREGLPAAHEPAARRFADRLLPVPEHTWGLNCSVYLFEPATYARKDFEAVRHTEPYRRMERSWDEQRDYLRQAVATLDGTPLAAEAAQALAELDPAPPCLDGLASRDPATPFETPHFRLAFDPATGAVCGLTALDGGRAWADAAHPLGAPRYEVFCLADYERYLRQFVINLDQPWVKAWAIPDYSRPGLERAIEAHAEWRPALRTLRAGRSDAAWRWVMELELIGEPVMRFGAPPRWTIEIEAPDAAPELRWTVQWFDKPASRIPEAVWFSFSPLCPRPEGWTLDKLGRPVSPLEVVRHGNRRLHGIQSGVRYEDGNARLAIDSLDAALVAPGRPALLEFDDEPLDLAGGMHFNLVNTIYPTNFPQWYDEDGRFRFRLSFAKGEAR